MKYKEIEFKYRCDFISLQRFKSICEANDPIAVVESKGTDLFFDNINRPNTFFRIRNCSKGVELTFKRKTNQENNYIRTEYNIKTTKSSLPALMELIQELDYKYNTSITKSSCVFDMGWYTITRYTCYHGENQTDSLGTFIELKISANEYFSCEGEAWDELVRLERKYFSLGVFPATRVQESLYELFRE